MFNSTLPDLIFLVKKFCLQLYSLPDLNIEDNVKFKCGGGTNILNTKILRNFLNFISVVNFPAARLCMA